jgi:hypothetical protein
MRRARALVALTFLTVGWIVLLSGISQANDCIPLLKARGYKSILTDPQVIQDCQRTGQNTAWVVAAITGGAGGLIAVAGLPGGTDAPGTKDDETKKKDCEGLLADFNTRKADWQTKVEKAKKDLQLLQSMYRGLQQAEQNREALIREQQSALGLLMTAGATAGAVAGAAAAAWASAAAAKWYAMCELGSLYGAEAIGARAFTEAAVKHTYYDGLAKRVIVEGVAGGAAAGAAAGKVVENMMESGLQEFNNSVKAQENLVRDHEQYCDRNVGAVQQVESDVKGLADRLKNECGIAVDFQPSVLPDPQRRYRGGGAYGVQRG